MYTSIALFALTAVNAATTEKPAWLKTDYAAAQRLGAQHDKPLVVLLSSGKTGWGKVTHDGELDRAIEKMLQERYVCVHVDTTTEEGKNLARQIKVPEGLGVVISDRTGQYQAFRHEGKLSNGDLDAYLRSYSDPNRTVTQTETGTTRRTSFTITPESTSQPSFPGYHSPAITYPTYQSHPTYSPASCAT